MHHISISIMFLGWVPDEAGMDAGTVLVIKLMPPVCRLGRDWLLAADMADQTLFSVLQFLFNASDPVFMAQCDRTGLVSDRCGQNRTDRRPILVSCAMIAGKQQPLSYQFLTEFIEIKLVMPTGINFMLGLHRTPDGLGTDLRPKNGQTRG